MPSVFLINNPTIMYRAGIIIIMLSLWISGCSSDKGNRQSEDSHQHADESIQFTLFSSNIEFFVEHELLEVGKESLFLVHLTDLKTYKPFTGGNVTISIDGVSVTSGRPQKPGIFEVPFIPGKSGAFHTDYSFRMDSIAALVEGHVHIEKSHDDLHKEDQSDDGHTHGPAVTGEIIFLKEQAWKNDFMVTEIKSSPFSAVLPTSGEILAVPGEKSNVASSGNGMIQFANSMLVQGSEVIRGQHLFTVTSETMLDNNIKLQLQDARNSFEKSLSEFERHKVLFGDGAISERQFISTKSKYISDSLRFFSLASNASEHGLKIYAPESGTIHELNVSEGAYVETGQIIVTISSNKKLLIRADLGQQFFGQLQEIKSANFRPAYTDQVYAVNELNGKLLAAGSSVAENNHYLPVIFEVQNNGNLLEGAFAEVFLKTSVKSEVLTVPVSAITEEQGEHFVYVQVSGESYTKRQISIGDNDGRIMEIKAGLRSGERVVTKGAMLIKAASMGKGDIGHGHSH